MVLQSWDLLLGPRLDLTRDQTRKMCLIIFIILEFLGEQVQDEGEGGRVEIKKLDEGKHQLIIHKAQMGDMGTVSAKTPSNKGNQILESKSAFTVIKGEEAPRMGDVAPVTGM